MSPQARLAFMGIEDEVHSEVYENDIPHAEDLEEQSFLNMVLFYDEELMRILRGGSISDVLQYSDRKKLKKHGVLGFGILEWYITKKAKNALLRARLV